MKYSIISIVNTTIKIANPIFKIEHITYLNN